MAPPGYVSVPMAERAGVAGGRSPWPPASALLVERMSGVERQAVVADGQAIAALVDRPDALVAIPAERTERAEHELVVIAFVRRVVIGDRRRGEAPGLAA